jgi:hypothetical protein
VRQAFVESLRKQGYASDGSPLPGIQKPALYGTAMLGAMEPILKLKSDALIERTDLLVDRIIQSQVRHQSFVNSDNNEAEGRFTMRRGQSWDRELGKGLPRIRRQ